VRRAPDAPKGMRQLPPDVEDLASGRSDYLRQRRRPDGRMQDPRIGGLVPGVPNHEARRVFDARVERLRRAVQASDESALEQQLFEAVQLGLWRARNVTGLDALCEGVIGLPIARGEALVDKAVAARNASRERLPDAAIALWMRSEAGLLEHCDTGEVDVRVENEQLLIALRLPLAVPERAADALNALGQNARQLGTTFVPERRAPRRPPQR
jgi:hypothetical protein